MDIKKFLSFGIVKTVLILLASSFIFGTFLGGMFMDSGSASILGALVAGLAMIIEAIKNK